MAGAGPAGSSCAITAARAGARVLLVEKDHFPRHKVCGEFVSSESLSLLAVLLGDDRYSTRPEIPLARILMGGRTISLPVSPAARSIPRYDLDADLLQSARAAGIQVEEGATVQQVDGPAAGPFVVRTTKTFTTRAVVNAAGRWSQLTSARPAGQTKWIGLKAHFQEYAPSSSVDLYFFSGGYCGVQPVSKNAVNAAAMVRADAASSMEQVLAAHPELWRRSRNWEPIFPAITTSPLYFRAPRTEDRGMMLAGDAAAFIDPFAGDGISLALQSGRLAADSLAGTWRGEISFEQAHRRYNEEYRNRFAPAFRNAARLRMFVSSPLWLRAGLFGLLKRPRIASAVVRGTRAR